MAYTRNSYLEFPETDTEIENLHTNGRRLYDKLLLAYWAILLQRLPSTKQSKVDKYYRDNTGIYGMSPYNTSGKRAKQFYIVQCNFAGRDPAGAICAAVIKPG